jgi:MFS family permease
MIRAIGRLLAGFGDFVGRQKRNYRVGVGRAAAGSFLSSLTGQYNAIYAVGLGADAVQLGSLSSVSSAISAVISAPVGWLMDRHGIKRFYLLATALSAVGGLLYALAHDWRILVATAILAAVSARLSSTGCSVICADSVHNRDRVTAQNVCGTLGSMASMVSPLIAASLVSTFGGMTVEGIRPLYYIQFVGYGLVLAFVAAQLQRPRLGHRAGEAAGIGFLADFRYLFRGRRELWRWVALVSLGGLPTAVF